METVKAAVMDVINGSIGIAIRSFPVPALEPGAVLLKTRYSEVCGTDVHLRRGQLAGVPYPIIPGHINVGEIEALEGEICDIEGTPYRVGDLVTFLDVHETCHACWQCLVAKSTTRCPRRKVYGITYSCNEGLLGGWSQKIYLKPGVRILRLPPELTPQEFIAGGCGAPTALHAVERAQIRLDESVVIQGCGPVGLNAAVFAMLSGAGFVAVVDPAENRLAEARALGVDETVGGGSSRSRVEEIRRLTRGRGADVTIEASGNPAAVREGLEMTRDGGTCVVVGQYTDAGDTAINPHYHINRKHIEIRGVWGIDFSHLYKTLALMSKHRKRFDWKRLISRIYSLEEVDAALRDVESLTVVKAVIAPNDI